MKIIQSGDTYNIYDDSVKSYDRLPPRVYTLEFDNLKGCYLMDHADLEVSEKAYGVHEQKLQKVMNAYAAFERSLGVILSGDKGIGKTMFAKKLCIKAIEQGIPVVLIEEYHPDMVRFIEKIEGECVVFFDEFDKSFTAPSRDEYDECDEDDNENSQSRLLSLFDGTSDGKKLFVITCNDVFALNEHLVNRPGRFHYHFRFEYPTENEIAEYMRDKLDACYHSEIPKIVVFSKRVKLNYDCLRAIAIEINMGNRFAEAISDLNIINAEEHEYDAVLHFENKQRLYKKRLSIDMYDDDCSDWESFYTETGLFVANVMFNKALMCYDEKIAAFTIPAKGICINFDDYDEDNREISRYMKLKPSHVTFTRSKARILHYSV